MLCHFHICIGYQSLFSGPPTSSNPIGFVHLTVANWKIECSSSDCKGYGSVMRQEKQKKICIHCHTLLCFYSVAMLMPATSSAQAEATSGDVSAISNSLCPSTSHPVATATVSSPIATTSSATATTSFATATTSFATATTSSATATTSLHAMYQKAVSQEIPPLSLICSTLYPMTFLPIFWIGLR